MNKAWIKLGHILHVLAWPALFVYLRRGERARVLITAGDKILLVKSWLGNGTWGLPGGGAHAGEDVRQAAIREVAEETGVQLKSSMLKPVGNERLSHRGLSFHCNYFVARLDAVAPIRPQRFEIVAVRWVSPSRLAELSVGSEVYRALELADKP